MRALLESLAIFILIALAVEIVEAAFDWYQGVRHALVNCSRHQGRIVCDNGQEFEFSCSGAEAADSIFRWPRGRMSGAPKSGQG